MQRNALQMDLAKCLRGLLTHRRYDGGITVISNVIKRQICGEIICISYRNNNSTPPPDDIISALSKNNAPLSYYSAPHRTIQWQGLLTMEGFSLFRLSRVDSCQSEGYSPFEIMLSVFSLDLVELYKSMTDISIVR